MEGRKQAVGGSPAYPGHGLVTAVQQFWTSVREARPSGGTPPSKDQRLSLLHSIRSAHERLGADLRSLQLGDLAEELLGATWVVVGEDVEVDLGVDIAPLVRYYHDRALSVVYRSAGEAARVAAAINADLDALPRAHAGYQGRVVVQDPVGAESKFRVVRAVGPSPAPIKLKDWDWKSKFGQ